MHPHRGGLCSISGVDVSASELRRVVGSVEDGVVACFVLKPLEVFLAREALFSLGVPVEDALWFVPAEPRPPVTAAFDALSALGVEVHRYPEVRLRAGRLRGFREAVRSGRSSWSAGRLHSRLSKDGHGVSAVVAAHNISAWVFAGALEARSWILIDSSRSSIEHGYLDAMRSDGVLGVLLRSGERGKGLSAGLARRAARSAPKKTFFFSMYGDSTVNVIHNSLPRLSADYSRLSVDARSALLLLSGREPGRAAFTRERLEAVLDHAPHVRRLLVKPHPRDTRPVRESGMTALSRSSLEVEFLPSSLGAEEIPMRIGYLPGYVLAESASTSLHTMQRAAGARVTTAVLDPAVPPS